MKPTNFKKGYWIPKEVLRPNNCKKGYWIPKEGNETH
jgi:hypothetical protein